MTPTGKTELRERALSFIAALIANDNEVYASSFGPVDGKYGLYIGTWDYSPSGFKRPRDLLTSEPVYKSAKMAKAAGEKIIRDVRKRNEEVEG